MLFFATTLLAQRTENVFIIVIDGARYTETFGDSTYNNIPNLGNNLKPLGTLFTSFYNDGITYTVSGHSSILTGSWQDLENDGSERPHDPTLFEYFRKQTESPQSDNFVLHGKNKLNVLNYSDHLDYGKSFESNIVEAENYNDIAVIDSVKNNLSLYHPKLTLINLSQVDRKGHDKIWDEYLSAIKQADSLVYDLWNFIQSDPIYKNKSTFIITNDHGRHTADFTAHGDNCEGCSHVMGLMIGPETPINKVDTTRRRLIDIAPTVASLLNFETPLSEGEKIDVFQKPTAVSSAKTIVKKFSLKQNYPNPFNPNTVIEFYIPEDGFTSLIIYDILGREAAQLLNEELDAGFYSFEFSGANLTSGIYFYRLQLNELVEVRKMSLIK